MASHTKNQRVIAQIPVHIYQALSQAAELSGADIRQFIIQSAFEKARSLIEKERVIRLNEESATLFFEMIENPPAPNQRLRNAMKTYKQTFSDAG
jgi:uncharacterized protein (DUF1778 family)